MRLEAMGRFRSPDPSRLSIKLKNPQTWNRYSYVYNNRLSLTDENGKWPTDIHNQIIDRAFPNLSASQRQILKNVSVDMDSPLGGGQANGTAFEHAMRSPGQTVDQAETQYNSFVSAAENEAQTAQLQFWMADPDNRLDNISDASLAAFGQALHAIEDSTSPMHAGFQEWNWINPLAVVRHIHGEETISPQQMKNAVTAAQNAFNATYGYLLGSIVTSDKSTVTTTQGSGNLCNGSTGFLILNEATYLCMVGGYRECVDSFCGSNSASSVLLRNRILVAAWRSPCCNRVPRGG